MIDNLSAAVTATPPWAVEPAPIAPYQGTNYLTAPVETTAGLEQDVTYSPTLAVGRDGPGDGEGTSDCRELCGAQSQLIFRGCRLRGGTEDGCRSSASGAFRRIVSIL